MRHGSGKSLLWFERLICAASCERVGSDREVSQIVKAIDFGGARPRKAAMASQ